MASILKVNEIQNASGTSALSVDLSGNAAFTGDVQADGVYNQSGDNDSGLDLSTNDVVAVKTGNTERMRVDNAGNVGIGTSSPDARITVDAGTEATAFKSYWSNGGNLSVFTVEHSSDLVTLNSFNAGDALAFGTTGTERMRIDASGNAFFGANKTLSDTNGFNIQTSVNGGAGRFNAKKTYSGTATAGGFYHNGSSVGSITYTNSSTSYNTSSDYRLKTDVQSIIGASARVQSLNPVNFEWISSGERVDGFLAHEAQAVVPEAVTGTKDAVDEDGNPEYQGIDQSKLVPLLTAALQEALTEIADLKARVTALETPA